MITMEKNILKWMIKYKGILFFLCICFLGLLIRVSGFSFISPDMSWFLIGWFSFIQENGGISSLAEPVGNYNVLYQTVISLMTYIPVNCVYLYKILSLVFDYGLAFISSYFVCKVTDQKLFHGRFCLIFTTILMLPTVILNSSYWGQCDAIYVFFVILTLYCLYREKYLWAFIWLGVAFAFKLQTMFIVPFILIYYVYLYKEKKKTFSLCYFLISVAVFWSSGILAYLQGRNILSPFLLYLNQTDTYEEMYLNMPSFYRMLGNDYGNLKNFALLLTVILCGVILYLVLENMKTLNTPEEFFNTACLVVWTCVMFLPAMHERYTYLVDILLIMLTYCNIKYAKYLVVSATINMMTYGAFLFSNGEISVFCGIVYFAAYLLFAVAVLPKRDQWIVKEIFSIRKGKEYEKKAEEGLLFGYGAVFRNSFNGMQQY